MRTSLNALAIDGTVVIGEGERDEAPMLYIGEKVGTGGPKIDIALDPLEGTTITAKGLPNGLAVMAMAEDGGFLNAPDVLYGQDRRWRRPALRASSDLDKTALQNLADLAKAKKVDVSDLVVCILDRPRHAELIAKVREAGCAHHADRRRRRVGRDRHLDGRFRHRHLHGLGRGAGRRAGSGGAALHRRPDPGPPAVPQRRREGARQEVGASRTSTANTRWSSWPRAT